MKPTTTPGKARGSVMSEMRTPRPGKRLRCRKMPETSESASVATVTPKERSTVETRILKEFELVTPENDAANPSGPLPPTCTSRAIGKSQNAANTARAGAASSRARRRHRATGSTGPPGTPPGSLHFLQVPVGEGLLHVGHLPVVDGVGAR